MKTSEIIFIDTASASDFIRLASQLNGELKNDTAIIIHNDQWKGYIKQGELETGLSFQVWNCRLSSPALLYYHPAPASTQVVYSLVYNLNPHTVSFADPRNKEQLLSPGINTCFTSNASPALFELMPRKNIQFVYISMTKDWLLRQFMHTDKKFAGMFEQKTAPGIQPLLTACSSQEYIIASEVFEQMTGNPSRSLFEQSRIFLLISAFFERLLVSEEIAVAHGEYFKKIRQVEIILSHYLDSSLPLLRDIAEEVHMSESTLKRYFKMVYGKNLYEYYLQQKMELAKRFLMEKNMNVNEVAANLGYENVSNFIEVFKKYFGYLPGAVRKSPE